VNTITCNDIITILICILAPGRDWPFLGAEEHASEAAETGPLRRRARVIPAEDHAEDGDDEAFEH
jgi:hypothetical protein